MDHMKEMLDALEGMHRECKEKEEEAAKWIEEAVRERDFWNARSKAFWNAHQGLIALMNTMASQEATT